MDKKRNATNTKKPHGGLDTRMLTESFASPLVLCTYDGLQVLQKNVATERYTLTAETPEGQHVTFTKDACLFAVPLKKWAAVKSHIKRNDDIKALNLKPEKFLASRRCVQSGMPHDKRPLKIRLRNGLVLYGHVVSQDRYNLLMRVGGKAVLVFKHAVHEVKETPQATK